MFGHEQITQQPVFFILAVLSCFFTIGYFLGKRKNKNLFLTIFNELIDVIKPENQTYGVIGGTSDYYADFNLKRENPFARIDAKVTLLPRHLWPYLPIAIIRDKYDKLLIAMHLKHKLREEGHLIEDNYAKSRKAKIANIDKLINANVKWGEHDFRIYCKSRKMREEFKEFINNNSNPGTIRHITFIPNQKKCFIFMIPQKGKVAKDLAPVYQWILSLSDK